MSLKGRIVLLLLALLFILWILTGCGPAYHLKKAKEKGAEVTTDTVYQDVKVFVPIVEMDTVFRSMPGDTVTITKDRLQMKYVQIQGGTVYLQGKCLPDTIKVKVPYAVTTTIKAGYTGWKLAGMILFGLVVGALVAGIYFMTRR